MARVTHVKKAQQRYKTVPVLNADGTQKQTPVMRNGVQRVTKTGRPITRKVTKEDRNQPLPNRNCERCGKEIEVGQPYKHVSPKSGPYGGRTRYRCGTCPTWQHWELSSSRMADIWRMQAEFDVSSLDTKDDIEQAVHDAADEVNSVAEGYNEAAQNIVDGFGHETYQSEELAEKGGQLEEWAGELEGWEFEDEEPRCENCDDGQVECEECGGQGEVDCDTCGGIGETEDEKQCDDCQGSGKDTCPECQGEGGGQCDQCDGEGNLEPGHEEYDEWISQMRDAAQAVVDECPVG